MHCHASSEWIGRPCEVPINAPIARLFTRFRAARLAPYTVDGESYSLALGCGNVGEIATGLPILGPRYFSGAYMRIPTRVMLADNL